MGRTVEDGLLLVHGARCTRSRLDSIRSRRSRSPTSPGAARRVAVVADADRDLGDALPAAGRSVDVVAVDARNARRPSSASPPPSLLGPRRSDRRLGRARRRPRHRLAPRRPRQRRRPARRALLVRSVPACHRPAPGRSVSVARCTSSPARRPDARATAARRADAVGCSHPRGARSPALPAGAPPPWPPTRPRCSTTRAGFDPLVLVGGDGAERYSRRPRRPRHPSSTPPVEGVPARHRRRGRHDGLPVITKAGGFGDATTLIPLLPALLRTQGATP